MSVDKKLIKDDLYQAVNGEWLAEAEIADDKVSTGGFITVRDQIEEMMMEEVEKMAAGDIQVDQPDLQEFIHYYKKASDFEEKDALKSQPIQSLIKDIQSMKNFADLNARVKDMVLDGEALPFSFSISSDMKNTSRYALYLSGPSTILPDKSYYGTEQGDHLLQVFEKMMVDLLDLMNVDQVDSIVKQALTFDKRLAPHVKSREEVADYSGNYNPRSLEEVQAYSSQLDFTSLIQALTSSEIKEVIVTEPRYFEVFEELVNEESFSDMQAWILLMTLYHHSDSLSEEIRQIAGQYDRVLSGKPEIMSREKHAYYQAIGRFDQPFGVYYGEKYFGPEAKKDVKEMVEEMIAVYKKRLAENEWLSQKTIDQAIVKLDALIPLIGYPSSYPSLYQSYKVDLDASFYDNQKRFSRLENEFEFNRWNQEVDRKEWGMSAATVNAYFNPMSNTICFPAAILQAPFYSLDQTRSENFGGIGAVIAHEISHAFDNNGAKFDEYGNMENWWQEEDFEVFEEKAKAMVALFNGLETEVGQVNGRLTVSENIADQGGLATAYQAMMESENPDPEAFFINWARIWCQKARPEYQELLLSVDVHSPAKIRANVQAQLIDDFYDVFEVEAGDGMYLAKEDRVLIW